MIKLNDKVSNFFAELKRNSQVPNALKYTYQIYSQSQSYLIGPLGELLFVLLCPGILDTFHRHLPGSQVPPRICAFGQKSYPRDKPKKQAIL